MKKFVISLFVVVSIASAQPGVAVASVIDQCPYTPAWKCAGMPAGNISTFHPINSASAGWSQLQQLFMCYIWNFDTAC